VNGSRTERADTSGRLGIVVVSYGSSGLLRQNLADIARGELPPHVIVIVENHRAPHEVHATRLLAHEQEWELVHLGDNVGFGAGMNQGVARAKELGCSHFLLLNPDVSIDAAAVSALYAANLAQPMALTAPRMKRPDGTAAATLGEIDHRTGLTRTRAEKRTYRADPWLSGACLMVSRRCWDTVDGFDPRYFLYWEDIDLSRRVLAGGGGLRVLTDVVATHDIGATQRQPLARGRAAAPSKSPLYCFYNCRNRLLYATTHVDVRRQLLWVVHAPRYAVRVTVRHGARAVLRKPTLALAAATGTAVGIAEVLWSLLTRRTSTVRQLRPAASHGQFGPRAGGYCEPPLPRIDKPESWLLRRASGSRSGRIGRQRRRMQRTPPSRIHP
jgi:N-acetylglucosaminyl-diphospho-decaprenol L-rhamnosyltransferase